MAHYVLTVFRVGDSAAVAAATSRPEALLFLSRREGSKILGAAGFTLAAIATAEAATATTRPAAATTWPASIAGRRLTSVAAAVLPRLPGAATTTAAIAAAAEAAL